MSAKRESLASQIVAAAIYPSIGIARVGNSEHCYFIGPEVVDPPGEGLGGYRDRTGALKRQAARFRIYGLNAEGVSAYPSAVTAEIVDNYYAVTHQPGARWVPAAFIGGRLDCDVARDLPFLEAPLLVLWGKRAGAVNPARNAREYTELAKHAEVEYYVKSGLLPHEEEAELVAERIEQFATGHRPPG